MTDHPSNPPSQTEGEKIVELWRTESAQEWITNLNRIHPPPGSLSFPRMNNLAALIDSALAAQEARHQEISEENAALRKQLTEAMDRSERDHMRDADRIAEQEARHKAEMEKTLAWADTEIVATRTSEARMLRRLEDVQVAYECSTQSYVLQRKTLREAESKLRISHVQNAVLQREVGLLEETISEQASKLREAREALGMVMNEWVNGRRVGDGITLTTAQIALAAIHPGPAQQAADNLDRTCTVCGLDFRPRNSVDRRRVCPSCRKSYVPADPTASFGPPMSPEMMAKAERARKFFVPVPEDPLDVGPDPDYGLLGDPPKQETPADKCCGLPLRSDGKCATALGPHTAEQETPKPGEPTSLDEHAFVRCELQDERQCTAWQKCHHPACLALGLLDGPIHSAAPPAHGGGD